MGCIIKEIFQEKVLLVNESPKKEGNTYLALNDVAKTLKECGVDSEIFWIGNKAMQGCKCELISYDPEMCHLVGKIVNVSADESILDEKGKIDPAKLRPISFDPCHNAYLEVSAKVGNAFRAGLKLKI